MVTKPSLLVTVALALALFALFSSPAAASTGLDQAGYEMKLPDNYDPTIDYSAITHVVGNYFACYYRSLENLTIAPELGNYIADTEDTHLFLEALRYGINWRKHCNSGIVDTRVELVDVKYAKRLESGAIDIRAYVRVGFRYLDDKSGTMTSVGDLWEVRLDKVEGAMKIVSLDCQSSDYYFAKQLVAQNLRSHAAEVAAKTYTRIDAIDDAYVVINARIPMVRQQLDISLSPPEDEGEAEEVVAPLAVGVPYDGYRAGLYGSAKGIYHDTLMELLELHVCGAPGLQIQQRSSLRHLRHPGATWLRPSVVTLFKQ